MKPTQERNGHTPYCPNGTLLNASRIKRDIIVIGGSAGGIEVLRYLFSQLASPFPAAIGIVLHRSPHGNVSLASILGRGSALKIRDAEDGMRFEAGSAYVAPCDHHMRIENGLITLNRGPKENSSRPSVDHLFRSAAAYGRRVVAMLLTGGGDDGVDGMIAINSAHGLGLVQDPNESLMPYMPINALRYDHVDGVVPLDSMAPVLFSLATGKAVECTT